MGSNWVEIGWAPQSIPFMPITGYMLEYRLNFQSNWTLVDLMSTMIFSNITNLYPNAGYQVCVRVCAVLGHMDMWMSCYVQVRVIAENVLGVSEASDIVEVMTLPGIPESPLADGPEQVMVESTAPDTLLITWTIPQVQTCCLL